MANYVTDLAADLIITEGVYDFQNNPPGPYALYLVVRPTAGSICLMRIGDVLFFAPGIKFDHVDLNGTDLPRQFERRIAGFYLDPADRCTENGFPFAAGVILVTCIDALARTRYGGGVGVRFKKFITNDLQSFAQGNYADRFYDDFRNGLVHEARIKNGGQFTMDANKTVQPVNGILLVDPKRLGDELRSALGLYVTRLTSNDGERRKLVGHLKADFAADFQAAKPWGAAEPSA